MDTISPSTDPGSTQVGHIFQALAAVKRRIAASGIEKASRNTDQGYDYRGIDDVMDGFAQPLADNEVMVCPGFSKLERRDLTTANGKPYFFWSVTVDLVFLSLKDGSHIRVGPFHGEASDTQDKGTTKVQSVAYRVAMLLTFTCPLGPLADPEASDEVEAAGEKKQAKKPSKIEGLSPSQEKLLDAKLNSVALPRAALIADFGGVDPENFKDALAWIGGQRQT